MPKQLLHLLYPNLVSHTFTSIAFLHKVHPSLSNLDNQIQRKVESPIFIDIWQY